MQRKRERPSFPQVSPSASELQTGVYIPVREAAQVMAMSVRSVYGYIEAGLLPAYRIGRMFVVKADQVDTCQRRTVGRRRKRIPVWHIPPATNAQYLTSRNGRIRQGQGAVFDQRMQSMRVERTHLFPGTTARYIVRNQVNPDEVQMVLVWRQTVMPSEAVRQAAMEEFCRDLADILDWETEAFQEGKVVLTT